MTEVENHLTKSKIYTAFKQKAIEEGDAIEAQVTSVVLEGISDAYEKSKLIIKYMPEYTLHDSTHLLRVLYNMEKLIPDDHIALLSVPDLMLLILTAFFHDLGMAPYEYEIRAWKQDWKDVEPNKEEQTLYLEFDRFTKTYPDKLDEV